MDKKTKRSELTNELMQKEGVKDVVGLQSILNDRLKRGVENLLLSELVPKHTRDISAVKEW